MTQARLYGFSNADNRREATIEVRDKISEYLVNVEGNNQLFPPGLRGGIGFYRASSTGGFHLNDRPYQDVERFIEHLGVGGHEILRIAKFEQMHQSDSLSEDEIISQDSDEEEILSLVEDAMQRVNEIDVNEDDTAVLGDQVNGLEVQTVPREKVISGIKSHIYGITPEGWDEFRRIDGTWIVEETEEFLEDTTVEDFQHSDLYAYDCTKKKPQYIQPTELEGRDGFVVTVGTKY